MPVAFNRRLTSSATTSPFTRLAGVIPTALAWRQVARLVGTTTRSRKLSRLASIAAGAYVAYQGVKAVKAALDARSQGRRQEKALDQQLEDSFPASDAAATY